MAMKGQSSLEQLLMTALGLTFIGLILFFAMNFANDSIRVSQAQDAVEKLAKSADYVDSLGPMSQDIVDIYVPEGLRFVNVSDDRVMMRISLSSGDADVFAHTHAYLIGDIPTVPGPQEVTITATPDGRIRFGNAALLCLPSTITRTFTQGDVDSDSFSVTNVGDFEINDIIAVLSGNVNDIVTLNQPCGTLQVGNSDNVGLDFDVPMDKEKGVYTGWVTVTGSNGTECATAVTITLFVTKLGGPDEDGPIVTNLEFFPTQPTRITPIIINATGDDSTTGNSTIELCQLELDYSGIWNDMDPVDGAYDEIVEDVTYDVGTLRRGVHNVRVRCIDSELNIGEPESTTFSINQMLFVSVTSALDTPEQRWKDWMDTHGSAVGLSWGYNIYSIDDILDGVVDINDYDAVIMADAPNTAPEMYAMLNEYKDGGGYIIILAEGMKFALAHLNVSSGNSASNTANYLEMQMSHYITQDFPAGSYQITVGNDPIYYNSVMLGGDGIVTLDGSTTQMTINEYNRVITYGVTKPDAHTPDGDLLATRVIDYGISRGG